MSKAASGVLRARQPMLPRVIPFVLFMIFIGVEEGARLAAQGDVIQLPLSSLPYLYPLRAVAVAAVLFMFRDSYTELSFRDLANRKTALTCTTGLIVFALWVSMEWTLPINATPPGYDPMVFPSGALRIFMISCRVAGAVLVVPLMEELFWRSFLIRYLIDPDFTSVPIGRFTWPSFLVTTFLFGLEHHLFFAGLMAGAVYSAVLYTTRSVAQCVFAHAVTNLALACYVLYTGKWYFW